MSYGPDQTRRPGEPGGGAPPADGPPAQGPPPAPIAWPPAPEAGWTAPHPDPAPTAVDAPPGTASNGHAAGTFTPPPALSPPPDAPVPPGTPVPAADTAPPATRIFGDVAESVRAWFAPRDALRTTDLRRNLPFGIVIAGLNSFADALLLPSVVIAAFVARVSDSNRLVALVPVVAALAWALPGAIAGSAIANRAHTVLLALVSTAIRTLMMALLAFVCAGRADGSARRLLVTFFVLYAIAGCAGGFATLAGQRLPGRIATEGVRGRLVRWQAIASALAAILAALLVRRELVYGPAFPRDYLYLFFLAFLALLGVTIFMAGLTERANRVPVVPRPPLAGLRAAPDLLRLPTYRRYLIFRIVALVATLAEPFYVVYAIRTYDVSASMIGLYVVATVLTRVLTMYLWRGLARITGTRLLLQLAALCRALAAVTAIGLPVLYETEPIAGRFTSDESRARVFVVVFVCIGAAMGANAVAHSGLLLDILPPNAYADGFAFANGLLAVCSVSLIAGGIIMDRYDARALFMTALVLGLLTVLVGGILREPRRPLRRSGGLGPGIRRTEAFTAIRAPSDSFPTVPPYQR
jgi:hypothetical protein